MPPNEPGEPCSTVFGRTGNLYVQYNSIESDTMAVAGRASVVLRSLARSCENRRNLISREKRCRYSRLRRATVTSRPELSASASCRTRRRPLQMKRPVQSSLTRCDRDACNLCRVSTKHCTLCLCESLRVSDEDNLTQRSQHSITGNSRDSDYPRWSIIDINIRRTARLAAFLADRSATTLTDIENTSRGTSAAAPRNSRLHGI